MREEKSDENIEERKSHSWFGKAKYMNKQHQNEPGNAQDRRNNGKGGGLVLMCV